MTKRTLSNEQLKITTAQFEKQQTQKLNKDHKINSKIKTRDKEIVKKQPAIKWRYKFETGQIQIELKAALINSSQRVIDSRKNL